ncbi:MAG: hypothetical protein AAGI45_05085 [Cyanobacteria bacterium P01_H01_bin.26]
MAPRDSSKPKVSVETAPDETAPDPKVSAKAVDAPTVPSNNGAELTVDPDSLDTVFSALKTLLTTVDKLQKSRQEVGDIKPSLVRLLDGELLSGDELERLKSGVSGLSRLVKLYSDYQTALEKAQPAREMLDTVLKP